MNRGTRVVDVKLTRGYASSRPLQKHPIGQAPLRRRRHCRGETDLDSYFTFTSTIRTELISSIEAARAFGSVRCAWSSGPLTVRLASASSHYLHRPGDHSLRRWEEKRNRFRLISQPRTRGARKTEPSNFFPRALFRSYHLLKIDQFVYVVRVSLMDERHVCGVDEETGNSVGNLTSWSDLDSICCIGERFARTASLYL